MMKARQDNNMTYCIGMVYAKTEIKMSGPIELSMVCYQNKIGQ